MLAQKTNQLSWLKGSLSFIAHPILVVVDLPSNAYNWLTESSTGHSKLLQENKQLKSESLLLKARLQKIESLEKENTRLHSLLESSFKLGEQFISASLIGVNQNPNTQHILIDKGSRFDLYAGQTVLNEDGVIGQIIKVNPLTASIMLITDPNHAIPIEINRTGLRTIAVGNGIQNTLTLPYLPHHADIRIGDLLTTSGLGGVFPKGYPVAKVNKLTPLQGEAFMYTEAKTIAHIENIRDILLVWSKQEPIPLLTDANDRPKDKPEHITPSVR